MRHVHLDNKEVAHYANPLLSEKCFVHLIELYMLKLSPKAKEKDIFYCKPAVNFHDRPWYTDSPIGHNMLGHKLKDMFVSADLDHDVFPITV